MQGAETTNKTDGKVAPEKGKQRFSHLILSEVPVGVG